MSDIIGIDPTTGKAVFMGREDPNNRPIAHRPPNSRYCTVCKDYYDNSHAECPKDQSKFDDTKMECQVCHHWFDYLVGENVGNGKQGCEGCWKAPTERVQGSNESYDKSREID